MEEETKKEDKIRDELFSILYNYGAITPVCDSVGLVNKILDWHDKNKNAENDNLIIPIHKL